MTRAEPTMTPAEIEAWEARVRRGDFMYSAGTLQPCGTNAGFQRHWNASEPPCDPCRRAHNAYTSARRSLKRAEKRAQR